MKIKTRITLTEQDATRELREKRAYFVKKMLNEKQESPASWKKWIVENASLHFPYSSQYYACKELQERVNCAMGMSLDLDFSDQSNFSGD